MSAETTHPRLVEPQSDLADSYRALVREFVERGEDLIPFTLAFEAEPFSRYLEKLAACAKGEGIPATFVPHSTFWLVDGAEVVGVSNVRHRLTASLERNGGNIGFSIRPSRRGERLARVLLRESLGRAAALGVHESWLTCAKTNVASAHTMLSCGGVLVSEEYIESRKEVVQRYRIPLEPRRER